MKNFIKKSTVFLSLVMLVSCSKDTTQEFQNTNNEIQNPLTNPGLDNGNYSTPYFGFLFSNGSSNNYSNLPIESSSKDLLVGRWTIDKILVYVDGSGNPTKTHVFQDYEHKYCGFSFLQFNNNGSVFENYYHKSNGICKLYSAADYYFYNEADRISVNNFDYVYIVSVTETDLILNYDYSNTAWGPYLQWHYYYKRVLE